MKLSISKKIYLLVTLILALELCFVSLLLYNQKQLQESYSKEIDARKVSFAVNEILASSIKAGAYGVLTFAAQDKLLAKESQQRLKNISDSHRKLLQMKGLEEADRKSVIDMFSSVSNLYKFFNEDSAVDLMENKKGLLTLHMNLEDLINQAESLLNRMNLVQDSQATYQQLLRNQISLLVNVGVCLNIVIAFILAALLNRDLVSRTCRLLENFNRLAAGQTLLPVRPSEDEIGKLDRRFHEMAGVLQSTIKREQAILQNSTDIIISLDSLLDIQFINAACLKSLGYEPDELVGKEIDLILDQEDRQNVRKNLLQSQENDQSARLEIDLKHKDGSIKAHILNSSFSQEEGLMFCILHDVTEEKRLERRKSDFIAMVSHDMRSPLTALKLTLGLLEDGTVKQDEPNGQAVIQETLVEVDRLVRLVNDLLETERLAQGKLNIAKDRVDFEELATVSMQALNSLAEEKQINLEIEAPDKSLFLTCDRDRTIQVLTNLIGNAIKFSQKGTAVVISARAIDNCHEVSVKDEGPGISPEEKEQIFEQFHQVEVKSRQGSGLGLYISKQLVEAQGGTLGVESKIGSGSRFWFRLPVVH